ncbi:cytochrome bc1 complex Rieske iron-sulfur subunit [Flexivirga endophytica]|uniref:Cytochrome bc1 complex Rieske iron-sulfur subunit n=1 Tax=Flexivirga endophytica TaxID=1849103 RepID=A0A916WQC5_9MICO|nr:Rieske 2Fe-2S domain-containing protein [Flexivirga endophytica]GGB20521.1 cytochrome bc1 complex Rieske iron-sulfur subunit [Flexivirga endophytica]GHB58344.1 cytochrome bc1 complex Rieske iron-sulfur subunit [Flexivirga endophytica]
MTDDNEASISKEPAVSHNESGHAVATRHDDHALPERFENPGLPDHVHRQGDNDEAAARRSERQVATLFGLSMLATVLFVVAYAVIGKDDNVTLPILGKVHALHVALGVTLAVSMLGIGLGAIHWAKTLMSDEEVVEERHTLRSNDDARADFVKVMSDGADSAQIKRRPLIKYSLGGALGLFAVPLGLQLVGGLGPFKGDVEDLRTTLWDTEVPVLGADGKPEMKNGKPVTRPRRLMRDPDGTAIRLSDVTLGSVFHVLPEGINDTEHPINQKVKASVILISLQEDRIKNTRERDWGINGVVAYSKICTHVGCSVGLYEQTTHHLLCPCHQSTFDLTEDCKVIFGPAKRPLPQLKIDVDDEGYLYAPHGFDQPVGPSFWERG